MKKFIALVLAAAMVLSMAACGSKKEATDSENIKKNGKLVVGITDFEPMDYLNEKGEWVGFDADMAKAFAESLGVKCEFIEIEWDNKIPELNGGSIDCVWNGMTLTEEVVAQMNCTKAYSSNSQVVVVKKDLADQCKDVESMKSLRFAVETSSAGAGAAAENGLETIEVVSQAQALMEVAGGTADGAIIDLLMAKAMVGEGTSYPDMTTALTLLDEEYGVGFRKNSDLTDMLNKFFADTYKDGTMMKLAEQYGIANSIIAQ